MDMQKKKFNLAFLLLAVSFWVQVQAGDDCDIVSTAEVSAAFSPKTVEFMRADPSGMCVWFVDSSEPFSLQVLVQPSAEAAKALYQVFVDSDEKQYANSIDHETIGQASSLRLNASEAGIDTAALLVLNKDRVVKISYHPKGAVQLNDKSTGAIHKVGALSVNGASKADQQFGQCEWLPEPILDKLIGKKNRKVQRLGPNHCMASAQPGNASLTVMTSKDATAVSFNNQKAGISKACKTVVLPEFGDGTYAYYDCENPGNQVMSVDFYQQGVHLELGYGPAGRASTLEDLEEMKPLIKHVYELLTKG
ncbi:MAG: hypothetical protein AB2551_05495 [Candidatus Thiodiazotropha sp.]